MQPLRSFLLPLMCLLVVSACDTWLTYNPDDPPDEGEFDPTIIEFTDPLTGRSLFASESGRNVDGTIGEIAFRVECGPCHASRDGSDLAFFDFADEDIIRRGVAHVDTTTVLAIRDFIREVQESVPAVDRDFELFRPGDTKLANDVDVALALFGADEWPEDISVEQLLSIDPREIALSMDFPIWSSEESEMDWMPERTLSDALLDADGRLVRSRLISYLQDRSNSRLQSLVESFEEVATRPGFECEGSPGFHPRPADCLEARRWLASLTAMHLVRKGAVRDVPEYIADLWWRVGEAAVSWSFAPDVSSNAERLLRRRVTTSWLMLSWVYDPVRLGDNASYFSEFTKHTGEKRQGTIAYAYWLVTEPGGDDSGRMYDILLQMVVGARIPEHWFVSYANWQIDRINEFVDQGYIPETEAGFATGDAALDLAERLAGRDMPTVSATEIAAIRDRISALRERLNSHR